ncbi:hypothetical protein ACJIZ3_023075 [Penstemon smallii]|uniref:Myb-like domain-containing protein n=1 Tax=Penstemon smallii TaxID=265156 RepID=A0ABD3TN55_9LAMI
MPERKSRKDKEEKSTITLRRSPRFLQPDPEVSKPQPKKIRAPNFFTSPTKTHKKFGEISHKREKRSASAKNSVKSSKGYKNSATNDLDLQKQTLIEKRVTRNSVLGSKCVDNFEAENLLGGDFTARASLFSNKGKGNVGVNPSHQSLGNVAKKVTRKTSKTEVNVLEKRVTRNSVLGRKCVDYIEAENVIGEDFTKRVSLLSNKGKGKVGFNPPNQSLGNVEKKVTRKTSITEVNVLEKRATRSSVNGTKRVHYEEDEYLSEEDCDERVNILLKERKGKVNDKPHDKCIGNMKKRVTRSSSRTKMSYLDDRKLEGDIESSRPRADESDEKECGFNGVKKRKRDKFEKGCDIVGGWTEEQESALNRAYFTAKPTPHFWKKVAKMVPGKSAEECFERIQSDHMTPPQPRTRSRARTKSSSLSLSATNLLSPAKTKQKRLRSSKKSCLLAQKTVRQLLQKQHNDNKDYEADFFSVLEPTIDPSSPNLQKGNGFSSPAPNLGPCVLTRCGEMSSSAHKRGKTRLSSSSNAALVSPPVLKPIKNKALHEKYIDQLHYRDAKRKAESLRQGKCSRAKNDKKGNNLKVNSVKVAKDALIFEAQDAINKYRSLKSSLRNDASDDDSGSPHDEDEDEDEDEL